MKKHLYIKANLIINKDGSTFGRIQIPNLFNFLAINKRINFEILLTKVEVEPSNLTKSSITKFQKKYGWVSRS